MEAIEGYREMEKRYFDLLAISHKGKITKKERVELRWLGGELKPVYSILSKVAEWYLPDWNRRRH